MGLSFNPADYDQELAAKRQRLIDLLVPFNAPEPQVFSSPTEHFRLRAEFRLWYQDGQAHYAMFEPGEKYKAVLIEQLPIASRRINELMGPLLEACKAEPLLGRKLFQIEFLTTLSGEALVTLCYHRPIDEQWDAAAQVLAEQLGIMLIGRSRGRKRVLQRDHVVEELQVADRTWSYQQVEGGFTQPNGHVNQHMLSWALDAVGENTDDLLELYCGNGNFTLPLSTRFRKVMATELSKSSVRSAIANLEMNQVDNVTLIRLASEEVTQALTGVREFRRLQGIDLSSYDFGTVFVDPPRAGLDPATLELVRRYQRILYISCNPETLANNLAELDSTHRITRCALFDQFPYTHHMESGVLLERR
ncbi:tRNA (uridine(54)-C5)-methyltransferase TrmA [Halopseudomonas laoshanensis]|uniref:tRNA/tmRNA (uracil-C(5))-methyltransferase n=1 Tax=Halopseudomonas laoshanensis TaxID=2268758 RepID=A0A7V7KXR8_9GAMM|nr:tRNA (uridine(54)-C5)-methyltransferase TrmA [Halopseudomonas laoshanensis]KAA0694951.1 tRNA (uridine(54)-C5)-methyltransferase TrmA [Halopseudomonas laoshanensis]